VQVRVVANDNPNNSITEAGLDEFTISVTECIAAPGCPLDLDANGEVSASDLAVILSNWGSPKNDLDGDGVVGGSDLAAILGSWGACP
jgi:hypothetical protein